MTGHERDPESSEKSYEVENVSLWWWSPWRFYASQGAWDGFKDWAGVVGKEAGSEAWMHQAEASSGWTEVQTWREQVLSFSWSIVHEREQWSMQMEGQIEDCLAWPYPVALALNYPEREGRREERRGWKEEGRTNLFLNWTKWISLPFLSKQIYVMLFACILLIHILCLHCSSLKHLMCLMGQI